MKSETQIGREVLFALVQVKKTGAGSTSFMGKIGGWAIGQALGADKRQ